MNKTILSFLFLCLHTFAYAAEALDLSGQWRFRLDSLGIGEGEEWFNQKLNDCIPLLKATSK